MESQANTIRISSESLAKGRCANCFKPVYRVPRSILYRHRHNHSDSCIKKLTDQLIVEDVHTHTGDIDATIMLKCVKTLHKLVTAHNLLVMEVRDSQVRGIEYKVAVFDEIFPEVSKQIIGNHRDFIGMNEKSSTEAIDTVEQMNVTLKQPIKTVDAVALMKQFKHICQCVAPMPVLITGPGHVAICGHCKKLIVEEDND